MHKINIYLIITLFNIRVQIWFTGGITITNPHYHTKIIEVRDNDIFQSVDQRMPDTRFRHCALMINTTHAFLHGGRTFISKRFLWFDKSWRKTFMRNPGFAYGHTKWEYIPELNSTANNSYIYDFAKKTWMLVNLNIINCRLNVQVLKVVINVM